MRNQIILLSGTQGSGKTSLQRALVERLNSYPEEYLKAHPLNFSDPIYQMHNYCLTLLKNLGIQRGITKDGPLLQMLGTDWARKTIDEDIWVNTLRGMIEVVGRAYEKVTDNIVFIVGDCRFKNEFDAFPEALRVRLQAPKEVRKARCEAWRENDTHPSEIDLDDYEEKFELIFNTSKETTDDIAQAVVFVLKGLMK